MTRCLSCFEAIEGTVYVRPIRFGGGESVNAPFCEPCDRELDNEVTYDGSSN